MSINSFDVILKEFQDAYEIHSACNFCIIGLTGDEVEIHMTSTVSKLWGILGTSSLDDNFCTFNDVYGDDFIYFGSLVDYPYSRPTKIQQLPFYTFKDIASKAGAHLPLHLRQMIPHHPSDAVSWWLNFICSECMPGGTNFTPLSDEGSMVGRGLLTEYATPFMTSINALEKSGLLVNEELQLEQDTNSTENQNERKIPPTKESPIKDFSDFTWNGSRHTFTKMQAMAVSEWYHAYMNGNPELRDETVLSEIGSCANDKSRGLRDLFKGHPAWGTVIIHGTSNGTHRLADPPKK